ncbi:MAG TPA: exo-beta-N-acetylmuramidase NamZ domain-containing protein [Pyrinomonadaceae bacterium]|nr:exo-beta-N-acetylmuramidase NamZ domain-containing protein [Pyrinomonadaceae bacterium]
MPIRISHQLLLALFLFLTVPIYGQPDKTDPVRPFVSREHLARMDPVIAESIRKHELPGAVVLVSRKGRIVWEKAYGARSVQPVREAMTANTIFDLASLTKVLATATSIMILIERGQVRLNDPLSKFIPEIKGEAKDRITIEYLLTHRSGYAPDFDLRQRWTGYDEAIKHLIAEPLRNAPGTRFVYSDIGYIALGEVVRRVSGLPLDEFASRNIFIPLGMTDTGFRPPQTAIKRIAPTEKRRGQLGYLGDSGSDAGAKGEEWLRGEVHDPTSFRMGGVAGHAGLFSTARDVAIYCQMILNKGAFRGAHILSPASIATMTRPRQVAENGWSRGLGWDINTSFSSNRGDAFTLGSFGHTGFTGTSVWIDPGMNMFVVFLSNRVHPDGKGDVSALRGKVATIAASAITDPAVVGATKAAELRYYDELMRNRAVFNVSSLVPFVPEDASVLTGIDVLARDRFKQVAGLKLGLVTNHTGRDRQGKQTIDVLKNAPGVQLTALFSPEHGIRGQADEKVSDSKDEQTGLPIYSLYGETRRPKPEQLKNLDAIVFDIQDIGTRFYTYISTLGYVMEEAAKAHIPVIVLDRPNPINGIDVEGPIADSDKLSFTAHHPIPVRHGLTVGELAQLFNQQRQIGCDLRVIKMEGWRREMWFDATNLDWINPSPNMRSLTAATLYPGVGLLETTNVSVGRGTNTPFEVVGAPWINGQELALYLNRRSIAGVRFVPLRFMPNASVFQDEICNGINIIVTDRARFRPVRTGIEIAVALRRLYPNNWKVDSYLRLLVNAATLDQVKRAEAPENIERSWSASLAEFRRIRTRVLLYEEVR